MALSFCSNWESLQHLNSEMLISCSSCFDDHPLQPQVPQLQELPSSALFSFNNNNNNHSFEFSDNFIDPFLQSDHDLFYANLLPYFSSPSDALISLSPEIFPLEDFDSYNSPKRQKSYPVDHYEPNFAPSLFYSCVPNPPPVPEFLPEVPAPTTEFHVPASTNFSFGKTDQNVKKANGSTLSVQSIAARERRRKITEKTQELGKLIPGGHRMNTAEMFQAASKYVKFLQAQAKVLQVMEPKQERKEPLHSQELQTLLASPVMQEKLYSEEKCLVPKEFVETLANDPEIQSKPMIVESISQLLIMNDHS